MLEFMNGNLDDDGVEVRTLDWRELKVGLFGDWLESRGHRKCLKWVEEEAGWRLKPVQSEGGRKKKAFPPSPPPSPLQNSEARILPTSDPRLGTSEVLPPKSEPRIRVYMYARIRASRNAGSEARGSWYYRYTGKLVLPITIYSTCACVNEP